MEEIDIPPYFLCPISLQIMKDPVTICTGITFDRENIETWLFSGKNKTCPVTKQVLFNTEIIPNHTLRRLAQAWCAQNSSKGMERIPSPKSPVDKTQIKKIIEDAKLPQSRMKSLSRLKSIVNGSESDKKCVEEAGLVSFLVSTIGNDDLSLFDISEEDIIESTKTCDEALAILHNLQASKQARIGILKENFAFVNSLLRVLQSANYQSRAYATLILKSLFEVAESSHMTDLSNTFFQEIVYVLRDQISPKATKAALQLLILTTPWGKNRVKVVRCGAVFILIELLLEESEKRIYEMMLGLLEILCNSAEGRSELVNHQAGIAVVTKKILTVSSVATERAIKILSLISKHSSTSNVLKEMMQVGVVSKLCVVLQANCHSKIKEKSHEILKTHSKVWKNSTCINYFRLLENC